MPDISDTDLFPLPLTTFEEYMLAEDREDYPAVFTIHLTFAGRFQPAAIEAAFETALERHCLLRALVRESAAKGHRFEWVPAESPRRCNLWEGDEAAYEALAATGIDLRHTPGLRAFLSQHGDQADMRFQFHHACCDGLGGLQFIEDLLTAYHDAVMPYAPRQAPMPLDPRRLRERGTFGLNVWKYALRLHKEFVGVLGAIQFLVDRPSPLAGSPYERLAGAQGNDSRSHASRCSQTFTPNETEQILAAARHAGGTLNDLLIRDLFHTLFQWNDHGMTCPNRRVRIMIPTNLRLSDDAVMPAANVVSMVFLDRRGGTMLAARPRLFDKLCQWEMGVCKWGRLGLTMIHCLALAQRFRRGMAWLLPAERCLATAVLTNLGEPLRGAPLPRREGCIVAGDVTLQRIEPFVPLRPLTHIGLAIATYAGCLTLTLHYDPQHLTSEDGIDLLGQFARRIRAASQLPRSPREPFTGRGGR